MAEVRVSAGSDDTNPISVGAAADAAAGHGSSTPGELQNSTPCEAAPGPASITGRSDDTTASALSATAPAFIPATAETTYDDILSRLPESHKARLRGFYQDMMGAWVPYYVGALKSYSSRKGFGFVECAQSHAQWGCDIFIHKNMVPMPFNVGQPVEFAIVCNGQGQPQACDVNWLPRLPERKPPAPQATAPQAMLGFTNRQPPAGLPGPQSVATSVGSAAPTTVGQNAAGSQPSKAPATISNADVPRFLGMLKSFSPAQGYGFISCEEAQQHYQRDVYFDKSQLPTGPSEKWSFGQLVEFGISHNARGHPQARDIKWQPVPHLPMENGTLEQQTQPSSDAVMKLKKLMKLLQEVPENAIVTAIDSQGNISGPPPPDGRREVDYVTFVLNRFGSPANSVGRIKDFVKMLLLLMISKMLKRTWTLERLNHFSEWFGALAESIDVKADAVQDHIKDVVQQIKTHLDTALREKAGTPHQAAVQSLLPVLSALQARTTGTECKSLQSVISSAPPQ